MKNLTFIGAINSTGYGRIGRELFLAAAKTGAYNIRIIPDNGKPHIFEPNDAILFDKAISNNSLNPSDSICIWMTEPSSYQALGKINLGYSIFETDRAPAAWVPKCNLMDGLIVHTDFIKNTFSNSGVKAPFHKLVPGLDLYKDNESKYEQFLDKYNFLYVGSNQQRKGAFRAVDAFLQEFKNDNVRLIVKLYVEQGTHKNDFINYVRMKRREYDSYQPEVYLINEYLNHESLGKLYRSCNAFVFPSCGEGWGLTATEAIAANIPVITTNWSSMPEYINNETGYMVDYELKNIGEGLVIPQHNGTYVKCSIEGHQWAHPKIDHLKSTMRHVYKNPDEAKAKSLQAKSSYPYSWEFMGQKFLRIINNC